MVSSIKENSSINSPPGTTHFRKRLLFFNIILATALPATLFGDLFLILLSNRLLLKILLHVSLLHVRDDPLFCNLVNRSSCTSPKMFFTRFLFFSCLEALVTIARLQFAPSLAEANAISDDSLIAFFLSNKLTFFDARLVCWRPTRNFLRKVRLNEFEACIVVKGKENQSISLGKEV